MRLNNGTLLYFHDNPNNHEAWGVFINSPFVYYNNDVYSCSITFKDNMMRVHDLIRTEPGSTLMVEHLFRLMDDNIFTQQKVGKLKKAWITYKMNLHPLNFKLFRTKRTMFDRKKTIQALIAAALGSVIYLIVNIFTNGWLKDLISDNLYVQTFLFFFTIISIMQLWRPFSLRKELSSKDIELIAQNVYDKNKSDEEISRRATF